MAYASDVAELQVELRELLYPNAKSTLPSIPVTTLEDAESAAEQLRRQWNVGDRPLDNLVQTSEDRGVVVVGCDDETGLFDGLSGRCGDNPVTVINTHFPLDRQRLTLAHEIGHLVMDIGPEAEADEEKLAFRFAAALLVPAEHAKHELRPRRDQLDWGEIKLLKRKYGLSMSAWVRRAKDLKIISNNHYQRLNIERSRLGWWKSEPVAYLGDEEPLQLKQMATRAVSEGLMSPDRVARIGLDILETEVTSKKSEHVTVYDLLAMPELERQEVMEKAFALAAEEDFEIFEAYEVYDDYDEEFDAETSETD